MSLRTATQALPRLFITSQSDKYSIVNMVEAICPNIQKLMDGWTHSGFLPLPSSSSLLSLPQVSCPVVFAVFCRLSTTVQYWWGLEVQWAAGHAVRGAAYTGTVLEGFVYLKHGWASVDSRMSGTFVWKRDKLKAHRWTTTITRQWVQIFSTIVKKKGLNILNITVLAKQEIHKKRISSKYWN